MSFLTVEFRQDRESNWWTATMPDVPAVVTQGKTLREAYQSVRDALSLVREDADRATLRGRTVWDRPDLSEDVLRAVRTEGDLRLRSIEAEYELEQATREAVHLLIERKRYSFREAGQLLGITHQRVEQISKLLSQGETHPDSR